MNSEEFKERFNNLTVWKRGGERAPHKPLLALYAIGRALRGEPRMVEYAKGDANCSSSLARAGDPITQNIPFGGCRMTGSGN